MLMPNGPAAWVSMDLGAKGGARTPVSACASGAEALALGQDLFRSGRADEVVAGGVEACLHPITIAAFAQMKALSTQFVDPETVSRPFDVKRSGFVMGEGAGMMVLERAEFAGARGVRVYGTLAGSAVSSSADHITAFDAEGQAFAMELALRDAGLAPADIGVVHAHATSTESGTWPRKASPPSTTTGAAEAGPATPRATRWPGNSASRRTDSFLNDEPAPRRPHPAQGQWWRRWTSIRTV
jgi:3-oxoacyl-[acyl-carrier-protein] synthase II